VSCKGHPLPLPGLRNLLLAIARVPASISLMQNSPAFHTQPTIYWGSQNLQKLSLDASERVAFYRPCVVVNGVAGYALAGVFPDFGCVSTPCETPVRGWREHCELASGNSCAWVA
jgi:hypothetical protein